MLPFAVISVIVYWALLLNGCLLTVDSYGLRDITLAIGTWPCGRSLIVLCRLQIRQLGMLCFHLQLLRYCHCGRSCVLNGNDNCASIGYWLVEVG